MVACTGSNLKLAWLREGACEAKPLPEEGLAVDGFGGGGGERVLPLVDCAYPADDPRPMDIWTTLTGLGGL